jgi:hypothetical protein
MQLEPCKQSEEFGLEKRRKMSQKATNDICYKESSTCFLFFGAYLSESTTTFVVFIDVCSSCEQLCELLQEQDVEKRGLPEEEGETKAYCRIFIKFKF